MMTATATWQASYHGYRLSTTMGGTIDWWRTTTWFDGRSLSVAAGQGNPFDDPMVPIAPDGSTTYYAQSSLGTQESVGGLTPPPSTYPILNIPSDPLVAAVQVTVQTQREWSVSGRTAFYDVIGRNIPYVEPLPAIDRTGQIVLRQEHPGGGFPGQALTAVRDMLKTGKPMLLRTVCPERVETLAFVATEWTEVHFGDPNAHGPSRMVDITWRAVEPLFGDDVQVAANLWFQVPGKYGTWAQLEATGLTWDQLAWGAA